jgi:hypothetical protein
MTDLSNSNYHFNHQTTILTLSIGGKDIEIADFLSIDNGEDPRTRTMTTSKNGKDFITNTTGLSQPRTVTITFRILGLEEIAVLDDGIGKGELIDMSVVDTSNGKTIQGISGVAMKKVTLPTIAEEEPTISLMIQFAPDNYNRN